MQNITLTEEQIKEKAKEISDKLYVRLLNGSSYAMDNAEAVRQMIIYSFTH